MSKCSKKKLSLHQKELSSHQGAIILSQVQSSKNIIQSNTYSWSTNINLGDDAMIKLWFLGKM